MDKKKDTEKINNSVKKKALAVLSFPKTLYDFLWIYLAYGLDYEWDLLALPIGKKDEEGNWIIEIDKYASRIDIFHDIIRYKDSYVDGGLLKKIKKMIKYIGYALIGKQTVLTKKDIKKIVDIDKYDNIVTTYQGGLFIGELVTLSSEINISLLEDGSRDYLPHRRFPTIKTIRHEGIENEIAGFLLSKMGYADVTTEYDFKPLYNCIKYSSNPSELLYDKYREIRKLHDYSIINMNDYKKLISKVFEISVNDIEYDAILFTTPLKDVFEVDEMLNKNICNYISKMHEKGRVIIKRHHRDTSEYSFSKSVSCDVILGDIPAEVFLNLLNVKKVYFMWPSAVIMSLPKNIEFSVLFDESCSNKQYSKESLNDLLKVFNLEWDAVVEI